MLKNYLITAVRDIKNQKAFSSINILGLAIGLACFFLIMFWVEDELGYDRFHKNADNIFLLNKKSATPGVLSNVPNTPIALGRAVKEQLPEVVNSARMVYGLNFWSVRYKDKYFTNESILCTEPSFFEMFDFPFLMGDPATALSNTYSVVLTEKLANKYFGKNDPLGEVIHMDSRDYQVTGIIKDIPSNSHLKFDVIFPLTYWRDVRNHDVNNWTNFWFRTYIQVAKNTSERRLEEKVNTLFSQHAADTDIKIYLTRLSNVYLRSSYSFEAYGTEKRIHTVLTFSSIAFVILILACMNYVLLSTARASRRAKEIGIRKVAGAGRKNLIFQLLSESFLQSFVAALFSILIVELLLPVFNDLSGKQMSFAMIGRGNCLMIILSTTLLTGLCSGLYPSLSLSAMQPYNIIKGFSRSGDRIGVNIRRILVIAQFSFSMGLIVFLATVSRQMNYIDQKDLGYDKNNLISFERAGIFNSGYEAAKAELLNNPNILGVTRSEWPVSSSGGTNDIEWEGKSALQVISLKPVPVDYDYLDVFKIKLAYGRFFSPEFSTDTHNYLLNETGVKTLGIDHPIGKQFTYQGRTGSIIGVIKDFHHQSFRNPIQPQFYYFSANSQFFCVRIRDANYASTMDYLETKWKELAPGLEFRYYLGEDFLKFFYRADTRMNSIIVYFAVLALIISCLGLLGLSLFIAQMKAKEIGIRKVLGSSSFAVVILLLKNIVFSILVAGIIAWPVVYYAARKWLQKYVYRIDLGIGIFILPTLVIICMALLTVAYQSIKAAMANPADTLKFE